MGRFIEHTFNSNENEWKKFDLTLFVFTQGIAYINIHHTGMVASCDRRLHFMLDYSFLKLSLSFVPPIVSLSNFFCDHFDFGQKNSTEKLIFSPGFF